MKHNVNKTIEVGILLVAISTLILVGCGGGGSSSATSAPGNISPNVPTVSTNQVEIALSAGLYQLWGFGMIVNGVPQVFISKTDAPTGPSTDSSWGTQKIFGAVSSTETAPRLDDLISMTVNPFAPYWIWSFPASSVQADVFVPYASSPTWTITLNQQDISGQTVLSQIKKLDGSLVSPNLANASAVFPAGSVAYTTNATNELPMTIQAGRLYFVDSEATLFGSGWCSIVAGQAAQLGVQINNGGIVSLYSVTGTCSFTALTAIGTGSWTKNIVGSDIVYSITYPAALMNDPAWAPAFANGYSPASKIPNLIINPTSTPTVFNMAIDLPTGQTFTSLQPFFNATALPALRSAAGF